MSAVQQEVSGMVCCYFCADATGGHTIWCPAGRLKELERMCLRAPCPACKKDGVVGMNAEGCYECRECHTQFVAREAHPDRSTETELLCTSANNYVRVVRLETKGVGHFPIDENIGNMRVIVERGPVTYD